MTATAWAILVSLGNVAIMLTLARGLVAVRAAKGGPRGQHHG